MASFCLWLLGEGYTVRVFGSDIHHDSLAMTDLITSVVASPTYKAGQGHLTAENVSSVRELLTTMAAMDYVITPRFHGVVFAHILNKPVLALSHDPKVSTLMSDIGLAEYCFEIDAFKDSQLREAFALLMLNESHVRRVLRMTLKSYQDALNRQSDELFASRLL
jgi:polysaccharide pyruvyl transferase WcaK-like protein